MEKDRESNPPQIALSATRRSERDRLARLSRQYRESVYRDLLQHPARTYTRRDLVERLEGLHAALFEEVQE